MSSDEVVQHSTNGGWSRLLEMDPSLEGDLRRLEDLLRIGNVSPDSGDILGSSILHGEVDEPSEAQDIMDHILEEVAVDIGKSEGERIVREILEELISAV